MENTQVKSQFKKSSDIFPGLSKSFKSSFEEGFGKRSDTESQFVSIIPVKITHKIFGTFELSAFFPCFFSTDNYSSLENNSGNNEVKNWVIEFLNKFNLNSPKVLSIIFDMTLITAFGFDFNNESSLKKRKLLAAYCTLGIHFDDIMEEENNLKSSKGQNQEVRFKVFGNLFENLIKGTWETFEEVPNTFPSSMYSSIKAFFYLFKKFRKIIPDPADFGSFIYAIKNTFIGSSLLFSNKNKSSINSINNQSKISVNAFKILRRYDGGVFQLIELWSHLIGFKITEEMRKNCIFESALNACVDFCCAANDLIGLKKDLRKEEHDMNLVLYRTLAFGVPIEDSIKKRNREAIENFNNFIFFSTKARDFFNNNADFDKFLFLLGYLIDTHGQILAKLNRYKDTKMEICEILPKNIYNLYKK